MPINALNPINEFNPIQVSREASPPISGSPSESFFTTPQRIEKDKEYFIQHEEQLYQIDRSFRSATPLPFPSAKLSTGEWLRLIPVDRKLSPEEQLRIIKTENTLTP